MSTHTALLQKIERGIMKEISRFTDGEMDCCAGAVLNREVRKLFDEARAELAAAKPAEPTAEHWYAAIMDEWHKHPSFDTEQIERRAYELAGER